MSLHIYIPTFRRCYEQITFGDLPKSWHSRTTFVVDEQDAKILQSRYSKTEVNFWVHPPEITTIAKKRAWMIENTPHEKIVMFDDDLRFYIRREDNPDRLRYTKEEDLEEAFDELDSVLNMVVHAGLSARQGNNHQDGVWIDNARMMYCLGYRVDVVRRVCELGRIEHREDMDYTLQLLRAGYPNRVNFRLAVGQKAYNAKGGASVERTMEASNADAHKLAELHPGLVKVVQKKYKQSIRREEVICYWKKAAKEGGCLV